MQLNFNARNVDPTQVGEKWPDGTYPVEVTKDELKDVTGKPHNKYVEFTLTCLAGPMKGKALSHRLNLYNDSTQSVEIAYRQLSAMCHVSGRLEITDTSQLLGARFCIVVGSQKDNPQYNQIFRVLDMNGNEPGKAQGMPPAPTPVPAYAQPQPGVPAYAQPAPAPTPAAPALPAGGWQPPPRDSGSPAGFSTAQPAAAAFPVPATPAPAQPSNWQPGTAPAGTAAPWQPGQPIT